MGTDDVQVHQQVSVDPIEDAIMFLRDEVLIPGDLIVVVEDKSPDKIGSIHLPERSQAIAHSGTIVGCGLEAPAWGAVRGRHVYYRNYAGTRVRLDGMPLLLLSPDEVVCFRFEQGENIYAPTGYLLVEREEMPEMTAGNALYVPHGLRKHTLCATAIVVDDTGVVNSMVQKGDRVLLSTNAGKEVEYEGRTVLKVAPERILLVIPPDTERPENEGKDPRAAMNPADFAPPEATAEEGTPEALR